MPTLADYVAQGVDITTKTSAELEDEGYIAPLNELPVVITGPGEYRTRLNHRVVIEDVRAHGPLYHTYFNCTGTRFRPVTAKYQRATQVWGIWHQSGRFTSSSAEHRHDIIGPWVPFKGK
jgi:hypothetical protein